MIIGLYDADFSKYNHTIFNIDLMKLASFYKGQRQIVALTNSNEWDKYTRIIYRKDYYDGEFPSEYFGEDWFEYGGKAFTQDNYISLEKNIERCHADVSIYAPLKEYYMRGDKKWEDIFNIQMNSEHLRLSMDGENIWSDYTNGIDFCSNTCRNIIFHDYDVGKIKGAPEEIKALLERFERNKNKRSIGFKFPVQVSEYTELKKWCSFPASPITYTIQFNGILSNDEFIEFVGLIKNAMKRQQFIYNVPTTDIKRIMPQLLYASNNGVFMILKTDDRNWDEVCSLISNFCKNQKWPTMIEYAKHLFDKPYKNYQRSKEEARQIFNFVRQNDEELFEQFYKLRKDGGIKND